MDQTRRERSTSLDLTEPPAFVFRFSKDAFDDLRGELERSFGSFELPAVPGLLDWQTGPLIDVVEGDDEVLVLVDVPGVKKQDLELSVTGSVLSMKGDKKQGDDGKGRKTVRRETWNGSFSRTLSLPDSVNPDKVEALLKDGILRVRIAKREEARKKTVRISVK